MKTVAWGLLIFGFVYGAFERTGAALLDRSMDTGEVSQLTLVGLCIVCLMMLYPDEDIK